MRSPRAKEHDRGVGSTRASSGTARAFVGREQELLGLQDALQSGASGRGGLVLIGGEPGIGKTRLAVEFAARAEQQGARVYWGRCWEAGGAPAYWPWIQCLRRIIADADDADSDVAAVLADDAAEIAQLLPELRRLVPTTSTQAATSSPEIARFRLFDAITRFLGSVAETQPTVLVLEDLHAADASSLLLLNFAAGVMGTSRLLVVGTYRDVEVTPRDPLAKVLSELLRAPHASPVSLSGLDAAETARVIEAVTGQRPSPEVAAAIHSGTNGNPLFVVEIVRLLAADGRLSVSTDGRPWPIPEGVAGVINRRLARLSEASRAFLELAAVIGQEFGAELLERVTEQEAPEILDCLRDALDAHLLRELDDDPGTFRFAHSLVRDALYEGLVPTARIRLHKTVGEALESLYATDPDPHLSELAHHFLAATPGGDASKGVEYAIAAGKSAVDQLAFEEAVRLYRTAHRALRESPREELRCEVLLLLGDAQGRAGETQESKETFLKAAEIATRLNLPDLLARAAIGYAGRFQFQRAGIDRHVIPLLKQALDGVGPEDSALRVRLQSRLAGALRDQPTLEPRTTLARDAVAMARRVGDPDTLTYALIGLWGAVLLGPDGLQEMDAVADELDRLAEESGDRELQTNATWVRFAFYLARGETWNAREQHETIVRLAHELGQPPQQWYGRNMAMTLALQDGRFAEAEHLIEETYRTFQRAQPWDAASARLFGLFAIRREQGRLSELEDVLRTALTTHPGYRSQRCMILAMLCDDGRVDEARPLFEQLAMDDFAGFPKDNEWLFALTLLAEAAHVLGDRERAEILYGQLLPYADQVALAAHEFSVGPVTRPLGILAGLLGRYDEAIAHFEDAIERTRLMGAKPWTAHAQHAYATMLVERGDPDERDLAVGLFESAAKACDEVGMTALGDRVGVGLAALGRRRPQRRTPETASVADAAPASPLTPRESEVAGLVAEGKSNREIAEQLYLSPRTVETHVQNILMKLGFTSRTQIASWLVRSQTVPIEE